VSADTRGRSGTKGRLRRPRIRRGLRRYARRGGQRIAYERRGTLLGGGKPWLVLVQGLGFDRNGWEPVVGRLRRHFRLVLVDNRGSGDSVPSTERFTVADMARDVIAVLDHAGIEHAHILGLSLGGMIAQEVAAGYPDRVDGLVLAATTPGWPVGYPMPPASLALLADQRRLPPADAVRRQVVNALSARTVAEHPELVDRLVAHVLARPTAQASWVAQAAAGARYAGGALHGRIRARTLVLQGDADSVVDPRNAQVLVDRIPDSRVVMFPGRGHLFFWEDPDGFVAAVTSFLLAEQAAGGAADRPPTQRNIT
jgi:pimeloyl-ACP methyl ester carboxylesterase